MTDLLKTSSGISRTVAVLSVALCIACSADPEVPAGGSKPGSTASPDGEYAVKAYVHKKGERKLVKFGSRPTPKNEKPDGEPSSQAANASGERVAQRQEGLKVVASPGGLVDLDVLVDASPPGFRPVWYLHRAAIAVCLNDIELAAGTENVPEFLPDMAFPAEGPWSNPNGWFEFTGNGPRLESCDQYLAAQEVLLCAADRLAEAAETVSSVKWSVTVPGTGVVPVLEIPAQAERDKFILRDEALNLLAHVAFAEFGKPSAGSLGGDHVTCTDAYLNLVQNGSFVPSQKSALFGQDVNESVYYPPKGPYEGTNAISAAASGRSRLEQKTHILRASGRLLRSLVDRSVQADMAGAEQRRAGAGDTRRGAELMWGIDANDDDAPYNSLRHALKTLVGRLESSRDYEAASLGAPPYDRDRPRIDPECGQLSAVAVPYRSLVTATQRNINPALRDIMDALGTGFDARWHDLPVSTAGQALATSIISELGPFIPPHARGAETRSGLESVIIVRAAQRHGLFDAQGNFLAEPEDFTHFVETNEGYKQELEVFGQLSDADVNFGLDRSWDALRSLANLAPNEGEGAADWQAAVAQKLEAAGIDVFVADQTLGFFPPLIIGGVPREDLLRAPTVRVLPAQMASQCPTGGTSNPPPGDPSTELLESFQSTFMVGEVLRRRLAVLRDRMTDIAGADDAVVKTSKWAAAELGNWAAAGRVYYMRLDGMEQLHRFTLTGVTPRWFDVDASQLTLAHLSQRVAMVRGTWNDAACVAGLRKTCSDTVQADAPVSVVEATRQNEDRFAYGMDGLGVHIDFTRPISEQSSSVFLVLKPDGRDSRSEGRVLAGFNPAPVLEAGGMFSMKTDVISPYRDKLINELFGISTPFRDGNLCVGDDSTTSPLSYCIEGVPRDFFVPLANELTQETGGREDSWKHYLRLAEDAAAHVDQLGSDIISLGLTRDLRREAAQEALGRLCGDFLTALSLALLKSEQRFA